MSNEHRIGYLAIILWLLVALGLLLTACDFPEGVVEGDEAATPDCALTQVQDPLRGRVPLPATSRGFLANENHLGWDLPLPEGQPIYPIGCGVIRLARAAQGYGTLVVVIEHRLGTRQPFINGDGERVLVDRFLSIYGHLRSTRDRAGGEEVLSLMPGRPVTPNTLIGYVQNGALNGDGDEHLHFGLRLQTAAAAQAVDPSAWFRGYDTLPSQKGWFTDPEEALPRLRMILETGRTHADAALDREREVVPADATAVPFDVTTDRLVRSSVDVERVTAHPDAARMDVIATTMDHPELVSDIVILPSHSDAGIDQTESLPDASPMLPDHLSAPPDLPMRTPDVEEGPLRIRYEFRVRSEWRVTAPYRLRDRWWNPQTCLNTGSIEPELTSDGWVRCETGRLNVFDGSFYLPDQPDWGDMGQIGTLANTPQRCTPVTGAEWRLTDLTHDRVLFNGRVAGLPCAAVGTQDRVGFPP